MRLKDKVAIITGGSRGIGFATADKFLKEGASVVLAASSQESADVAVDKLKEKYPNAIVAGISPNLASMESVRKAFKETSEKYGCVGILVNNAGISENTSFMDYAEETFDKVIDLNIKGVFNATRVAAECMVARGKGGHSLNFFHGEYFGTAKWGCLSGIEVCSKRIDCIIIICHGTL